VQLNEFEDTIPSEPSADSLEAVIGPICGLHLACYSVATDVGYLGYAKICPERPESVWNAVAIKKISAGPFQSPEVALRAVMDLATHRLERRQARQAQQALRATNRPS
jgi:hypothetical protein